MFAKKIQKKIGLIVAILLGIISQQGHAETQAKQKILNVEHWTNHKGVSVYYVSAPQLPIVDIATLFSAGSARDGEQYGVAHMANDLLSEGTNQFNADQIAQGFADQGAVYTNNSARDVALLSLRSLSQAEQLQKALNMFKAVLTDANFPNDAFLREQKNTLTALAQQLQSPAAIANNHYFQALYANHPYSHPVLGDKTSIEKLKREDVLRFYQQYYVAKNLTLVIVGDVTRSRAAEIADFLSEKLPVGDVPAALPDAKPLQATVVKQIEFPSEQTHMLLGQVGVTRQDPHYIAWYLGNSILGGEAFISDLFQNVREKNGYAYSVYSSITPMAYRGPFTIGLQTRTNKAQAALQLSKETLTNFLKTGPSQAQLKSAKLNITGSLPLTIDSNSAITQIVGMIGFYQLPLDYLDTFSPSIEAVNNEQIKQAFNALINPDHMAIISVGKQ